MASLKHLDKDNHHILGKYPPPLDYELIQKVLGDLFEFPLCYGGNHKAVKNKYFITATHYQCNCNQKHYMPLFTSTINN